jgi:aminoglycoside phosphotransferase (APT) family kinase protein
MGTVASVTKNHQSETTLRAMVERAYGPGEVPICDGWVIELGNGWFNVAYRIRLRSGREVVVKIAPPPSVQVMTYERRAMATELAALRLVRQHTSLPVPEVHFADDSHELCDASYFFTPYVDADNLEIVKASLPPEMQASYHEKLGAANRELNSIVGPGFGPLLAPGPRSWRTVFAGMVDDVLADGEARGVDIGWPYDAVREILADHAACLGSVTAPRYVEWDLWDGNVMVRDGEIVGLLDHERAFWGDPLIEFGFAGTQLTAFGDPAPFLRGYGKEALSEEEDVRRRLYCVYLGLVLVIEPAYRCYADPKFAVWGRGKLSDAMALFGYDGARVAGPEG